jgi:hypothetical protein
MSSTAGRKKTFSTCASHLTAVTKEVKDAIKVAIFRLHPNC